ncbi:signal peptidase I [Janibacter sp. DB-40]|uniref:signal peptidase I n=1 Tax=Janibacter sp. DB-40 TaxID=3028808 RepID=UPI00240612F7|nr:signal peptidase I [Janibacter sp. DB-40]
MSPRRERRELPLGLGVLVRLLIAVAVLALVTHTLVRPFVVPSGSMEPTIMTGDRVTTRIVGVEGDDLDRGDVIAFAHGRTWADTRLREPDPLKDAARTVGDVLGVGPSHRAHTLKRIVGLPGETVSCCDEQGRVLVDEEPIDEPYVEHEIPFAPGERDCTGGASRSGRCLPEITVPDGAYLVMGDNRASSADSVSACRGQTAEQDCTPRFVRAEQVVGTLWLRWWPLPPGDALRD